MIQRIQTLYLLATAILMSVVLFFPLLTFQAGGMVYEMDARQFSGQEEAVSTIGIFIVGTLSALTTLITIFFYKKRALQVKLTWFSSLLALAFIAYTVYLGFDFGTQFDAQWRPGIVVSLPVIAIILNCLAIKGIKADEALVRSLDRLR